MGEDEAIGRPPLPQPGLAGNRLLIIIASISAVIFLVLALFLIRFSFRPLGENYTKILTYLSAKDAAEVVNELKNLKIPYKLEDKGATILVPKSKADEARLGLASKNLPKGGVVGFEIFDKTGLGTTDFDRRIKFIRAISGELSRNISLIEGVEDARVQIVIPETQLFVGKKSPVTASVLLRLKPEHRLLPEQVKGIVHLVASSVEDLKPENVTVVDINGYVLSDKTEFKSASTKVGEVPVEVVGEQVVLQGKPSKGILQENIIDQLNYKDELERRLTDKAQEVLNNFYLPDKARVWVTVELGPSKKVTGVSGQEEKEPQIPWEIKKINAVILLDETPPLTEKEIPFENIKNSTFNLVATAIGYDRSRGDKIEMRRVPFAVSRFEIEQEKIPEQEKEKVKEEPPAPVFEPEKVKEKPKKNFFLVAIGIILEWVRLLFSKAIPLPFKITGLLILVLISFVIFWVTFFKRKKPEEIKIGVEESRPGPEAELDLDSIPEVQKIREAAAQQPEKLASVLKAWLTEEQGGE